ncbi:hypothetical protein AAG570_012023 [Ranatra chinensis]|uniref:CCHC-type domain-containing protein n=1 Tax=Ranatra chinensis TaxID=642074 RepID=A0ABD0YU03_9HEMI
MAVELTGELMMRFLTAQTLAMEMFHGRGEDVHVFINRGDAIWKIFKGDDGGTDATLKFMVQQMLFSRISGDVLYKLGVPLETATWPTIRAALVTKYSDPQPLESLNRELFTMGWRTGETVRAFGEKVQDVVRRLRARTLIQYPGEKGQTRAELYEELALQLFVRELPSYVGLAVRMKNPTTLDGAIVSAIAEDAARNHRTPNATRSATETRTGPRPISDSGWVNPRTARQDRRGCFRCGEAGHFARDCRRGPSQPTQQQGRSTPGGGKNATWTRPATNGSRTYRPEPMDINMAEVEAVIKQQVDRALEQRERPVGTISDTE